MKQKNHVLYVDDDEEIILVQKQILERFGYKVSTYINPVLALEHFRTAADQYNIAIIDLLMPSLKGDILAREIKRINPVLPVILCTGYDAELAEKQVSDIGVEGFLIKPIEYDVMLKTLERLLKPES